MSDPRLRLQDVQHVPPSEPRQPVGRILVKSGMIDQDDLLHALDIQHKIDAPLGDILVAAGRLDTSDVLDALSVQYSAERINLKRDPPAPDAARSLDAQICLTHEIVPWRWLGTSLMVATSRPAKFQDMRASLPHGAPALIPVIADPGDIQRALGRLHGAALAQKAVTSVAEHESARRLGLRPAHRNAMAVMLCAALILASVAAPLWMGAAIVSWAVITLFLTMSLKMAAFLSFFPAMRLETQIKRNASVPFRLPRISVMVPLFKEHEITGALIKRLERLTYPKSLLQVVLVLEAKDTITRETLRRTDLPPWMSVIEVPDDGTITTKPRALNYALNFCHGSIIGVWDAEDAPEPDQLEKVAMRFNTAPANVACLQGVLDYYNARSNWMARCFTIEYATWWRIVIPGMARLGLVLPLGGTTLFFRRSALETLGGWDAHNVTEDADLGVRLARYGFVTELLPSVTFEEANNRPWAWVRQRSRWLKGFMITYCVHMRRPRKLWRDLGFKRFVGLQIIFLATFSQFASLPLLWSFWLPVFGLPHPVSETIGFGILFWLGALFILAEFVNAAISMFAVSGPSHRHLLPWVLTMPFYFTLGALASYKALYEIVRSPFYWDKTSHGVPGRGQPIMPV